ncbi:MAG: 23S rRNA pseudouridine(955/2504/2580) synthase RluC [Gammaproteobacteria bacterium]|nr:23S rRNA pseudouridine(955/2504/2580) synthase RluC [Gammaproteobacteria bacterium]
MSNVKYHVVLPDEAGQRLDNFLLARFRGVPRSAIYRVVRKGQVRINKGRVKPDYRLCSGDRIRIPPVRPPEQKTEGPQTSKAVGERIEERIIHEDDSLLVIDKPAGLAVHGGSGISAGLIENLRACRPDSAYFELVHRLDRATSGCMLVAKKRASLRELHRQLREGEVEKRYLALLGGRWELGSRDIDAPLEVRERKGGERFVTVNAAGKSARTHFRPIEFYADATLLEATLDTGRTHQIRVHASWAGHPLAGDERYGNAEMNQKFTRLGLRRLFLHASALGFTHPSSGESVLFSAPLPKDLVEFLEKLPPPQGRRRARGRYSKG